MQQKIWKNRLKNYEQLGKALRDALKPTITDLEHLKKLGLESTHNVFAVIIGYSTAKLLFHQKTGLVLTIDPYLNGIRSKNDLKWYIKENYNIVNQTLKK